MNREILIQWLTKANDLDYEDILRLPCEGKKHGDAIVKELLKELKILGEIDPSKAKIAVSCVYGDGKSWVEMRPMFSSPLVGFIKRKDGEKEKVFLPDPDRRRRLQCMVTDGYTLQQAEEIEGELTEDERKLFVY